MAHTKQTDSPVPTLPIEVWMKISEAIISKASFPDLLSCSEVSKNFHFFFKDKKTPLLAFMKNRIDSIEVFDMDSLSEGRRRELRVFEGLYDPKIVHYEAENRQQDLNAPPNRLFRLSFDIDRNIKDADEKIRSFIKKLVTQLKKNNYLSPVPLSHYLHFHANKDDPATEPCFYSMTTNYVIKKHKPVTSATIRINLTDLNNTIQYIRALGFLSATCEPLSIPDEKAICSTRENAPSVNS